MTVTSSFFAFFLSFIQFFMFFQSSSIDVLRTLKSWYGYEIQELFRINIIHENVYCLWFLHKMKLMILIIALISIFGYQTKEVSGIDIFVQLYIERNTKVIVIWH